MDNNEFNYTEIGKKKLICKNVNSFILRLVIVVLSLFYGYYDYSRSLHKIESFTLALTDLTKSNAQYTQAFKLAMFTKTNLTNSEN
jgi:hypothetical protein